MARPSLSAESKQVGMIDYWRGSPIGEKLDNENRLQASAPKSTFVNFQYPNSRFKCRAWNAQPFGGP